MSGKVSYEEYDKKLLSVIRNGCNTFDSLVRRMDEDNKAIDPGADRFRVTDRRLQALRRKGFLIFHNREWHVQG